MHKVLYKLYRLYSSIESIELCIYCTYKRWFLASQVEVDEYISIIPDELSLAGTTQHDPMCMGLKLKLLSIPYLLDTLHEGLHAFCIIFKLLDATHITKNHFVIIISNSLENFKLRTK